MNVATRAVIRPLVAVWVALCGSSLSLAAADSGVSFKKGDKVFLRSEVGGIPFCRNQAGYKNFIETFSTEFEVAPSTFSGMWKNEILGLLRDDCEATVAEQFPPEGVSGDLASLRNVGKIPALIVKLEGQEAPIWVPAIFATPKSGKPYPVESLLPRFVVSLERQASWKLGDEASLIPVSKGSKSYVCNDEANCKEFIKVASANDEVGFDDLISSGKIVVYPALSPVLVIDESSTLIGDDTIQLCKIRLKDGPLRDRSSWIPASFLCNASLETTPKPRVKLPAVKTTIDPAARAKALLIAADATAKNGNTKAAEQSYRQIIKQYPESPEAKVSAERIKQLKTKK